MSLSACAIVSLGAVALVDCTTPFFALSYLKISHFYQTPEGRFRSALPHFVLSLLLFSVYSASAPPGSYLSHVKTHCVIGTVKWGGHDF